MNFMDVVTIQASTFYEPCGNIELSVITIALEEDENLMVYKFIHFSLLFLLEKWSIGAYSDGSSIALSLHYW